MGPNSPNQTQPTHTPPLPTTIKEGHSANGDIIIVKSILIYVLIIHNLCTNCIALRLKLIQVSTFGTSYQQRQRGKTVLSIYFYH